jgi:glycine/D-amino acid oxidase-like deaminating enzyme
MKRVLIVLALFLFSMPGFSMPAVAQGMMPGLSLGGSKEVTEEEKARAAAREEAARAASARIPVQQKASNDPWSGARDVTPPSNPNPLLVAPGGANAKAQRKSK